MTIENSKNRKVISTDFSMTFDTIEDDGDAPYNYNDDSQPLVSGCDIKPSDRVVLDACLLSLTALDAWYF